MQTIRERAGPTRVGMIALGMLVLVGYLIVVANVRQRTSVAGTTTQHCFPQGGTIPGPVVFHPTPGQAGLYAVGGEGIYRFSTIGGHLTPTWLYRMHSCVVLTPTTMPGPGMAGPSFELPSIQDGLSVANNMVFFGVNEKTGSWVDLYALHADNGSLAWKKRMTDASGIGGLLVLHDLLFTETAASTDGSPDYIIRALDMRDGSQRWSYRYQPSFANGTEGLSAAGNGTLYVTSSQTLSALNATTGKQMWSASIPDDQKFIGALLFDGVIYVTSSAGCFNCEIQPSSSLVYAFNAASGAQLWQSRRVAGYLTLPTESRGLVYAGSQDGHLYALRAADGTFLWQSYVGGELHVQPQIIAGLVCIGSAPFLATDNPNTTSTHLSAFDATTGRQRWSYIFPLRQYDGYQPIIPGNGLLYTNPSDDLIETLQASTGKLIQQYSITISGNFLSLAFAP